MASSKRLSPETMKVGAVFQTDENGKGATGLSFHRDGAYLISCGSDGSVRLIDAASGSLRKTVYCKKYGIGAACFAHHVTAVLHAGSPDLGFFFNASAPGSSQQKKTTEAYAIRYLSLHDNKYLRTFRGHEGRVTSIATHPGNDVFFSAGDDDKVAVWDTGSSHNGAVALLDVAEAGLTSPRVEVSRDGLVFAVLGAARPGTYGAFGKIQLFDTRNYHAGAFTTMTLAKSDVLDAVSSSRGGGEDMRSPLVDRLSRATFTGVETSPDGELILVKTDCAAHVVYDAFDSFPVAVLYDDDATFTTGAQRAASFAAADSSSSSLSSKQGQGALDPFAFDPPSTCDATFGPDSDCVIGGGDDGLLRVWRLPATRNTAAQPARLINKPSALLTCHVAPLRQVRFSPSLSVLASACANTALWLPPS